MYGSLQQESKSKLEAEEGEKESLLSMRRRKSDGSPEDSPAGSPHGHYDLNATSGSGSGLEYHMASSSSAASSSQLPQNITTAINTTTAAADKHTEQSILPSASQVSNRVINAMMEYLAAQDFSRYQITKTWGRILVEKYLIHCKWYNPHAAAATGTGSTHDKDGSPSEAEVPSLLQAWAYFEHVTLARHFVLPPPSDTNKQQPYSQLERAEPGETRSPTQLYNPFTTPETHLSEWGMGFGLYFTTLRLMGLLFFFLGVLQIPNMLYYHSAAYTGNTQQAHNALDWMQRGSAVCTMEEWVYCPDCSALEWHLDPKRFALTITTQPQQQQNQQQALVFVKHNLCPPPSLLPSLLHFSSLLLAFGLMYMLRKYQKHAERHLDEAQSTATDYSVLVHNPPPDALDAAEWKQFFTPFAPRQDKAVTCVTIALNNRLLLQKLVQRRKARRKLARLLPPTTNLDNIRQVQRAVEQLEREQLQRDLSHRESYWHTVVRILKMVVCRPLGFCSTPRQCLSQIHHLESTIKHLQTKKYEATHVFVTFETEEGQRNALKALCVGRLDSWWNRKQALCSRSVGGKGEGLLFRGYKVLRVEEPCEPSAVRWVDLRVSIWSKLTRRLLTLILSLTLVLTAAYLITNVRRHHGPFTAAVTIALLNLLIPQACKKLNTLEAHATEGGKQAALYCYMTCFRWINTVVLATVITPFTSTIGDGKRDLIPTIAAIFVAECLISPTVRVLDLVGNVKKHVLAPRCRTQEAMNLFFTGTPVHLAERYTEFTKVVLLGFFYSALYPFGFLMGAVIMAVQYFTDKYCLMRLWAPAPLIGTQLAKFSRRYFFSLALVIFASASAYAYAGFPYDNVCIDTYGDAPTGEYQVDIIPTRGSTQPETSSITITNANTYKYCKQNIFTMSGWTYPALPRFQTRENGGGVTWMTREQVVLTSMFGWFSFLVLVCWVLLVFGGSLWLGFLSIFRGTYQPSGENQHVDFSAVKEIFAYVPQIRVPGFAFPFLACDIDEIDDELIGWSDGEEKYSFDEHNLMFDVPFRGMKRQRGGGSGEEPNVEAKGIPIFSVIKHWPPSYDI